MTMQIREIILYNDEGDIRRVKFKLGAVNIITGRSSTGKTALIDIVEYCLGSDECGVREGVIRDVVRWYAVLLQFEHGQVFVARAEPKIGAASSADIYYDAAGEIEIPPMDSLHANTDPEGIISYLSRRLGITDNLQEPAPNQTRPAYDLTVRHALFLTFQKQTEIATSELLFHRQHEEHIPRTIRESLPYFLGAVDPDRLRKQHELRRERQRLRHLEATERERSSVRQEGIVLAKKLLAEAAEVGLVAPGSADNENPVETLRTLVAERRSSIRAAVAAGGGDELPRLRERQEELVARYRVVRDDLKAARAYRDSQAGFAREAEEQRSRLDSVRLFPHTAGNLHQCPVCESELATPVPAVREIEASLERLHGRLENATEHRPALEFYVGGLEEQATELRREMSETQDAIQQIIATNERLQREQVREAAAVHVLGRISLYVENIPVREPESFISVEDTAALAKRIDALAEEINNVATLNRLDSVLRLMSPEMTEWARRLVLRYSGGQVRLNPHLLTVVADLKTGPVPMTKMGGADNWLGYHLVAHLALHKYFVENQRPVPSFLFLDQPTSVYYPPDRDQEGSLEVLNDEDRTAVRRMFDFIFDVVEGLSPGLQVIITDHADLRDPRFQDAVVDVKWRGQFGLIPPEWREGHEDATAPGAIESPTDPQGVPAGTPSAEAMGGCDDAEATVESRAVTEDDPVEPEPAEERSVD